jgi:hypothetical protein
MWKRIAGHTHRQTNRNSPNYSKIREIDLFYLFILSCMYVIPESVRKSIMAKETAIAQIAMSYLRGAADRAGGRRKRAKNTAAATAAETASSSSSSSSSDNEESRQ